MLAVISIFLYGGGHLLIYAVNRSNILTYDDPKGLLWMMLTLIIVYIYFNYLYFKYWSKSAKNKKRGLSKYEKMNYSRLATRKEAVKGLTRIIFNKKGINYNAFYYKKEKCLAPVKIFLNTVIEKLNHRLNRNDFFVDRHIRINLKFYPLPSNIRAGMIIVAQPDQMWCDPGDTHTLINGTTGSGKTFTVIYALIQVIAYTGESLMINDMKGELHRDTRALFEQLGYDIFVISFLEPRCSDGWNPLHLAWTEWEKEDERIRPELEKWKLEYELLRAELDKIVDPELYDLHNEKLRHLEALKPYGDYSKAIEYVQDIAHLMCYEPDVKDQFWNGSAEEMIVGGFCLLSEIGNPEYINFPNIRFVITQGAQINPITKKSYLSGYLDTLPYDSLTNQKLSEFANGSENTIKSQVQVFGQKLSFLTLNDSVVKLTKKSDFDLSNLGKKKTVVFLQVHDEKKTFYPLLTLFAKQVYEVSIGVSREYESLRLPIPINMILDEFGSMPALGDLDAILSAARARGLRLTMVIQELAQLNEKYGDNVAKIIESNVSNMIYLLSGSPETKKFFSDACGTQLIWSKESERYEEKPVVSVDRLHNLTQGELVYIRQRQFAYISRLVGINKYIWYKKNKPAFLTEKIRERVHLLNFKEYIKQNGSKVKNLDKSKNKQNNDDNFQDSVNNSLIERVPKNVTDHKSNEVVNFKLGMMQRLKPGTKNSEIGGD